MDQFAKHTLRARHYFRYADDFIIAHRDRDYLQSLIPKIAGLLDLKLGLQLHPQKVQIRKLLQGIDFLGYVVLPHHTVLRTSTKRRMMRKLAEAKALLLRGEMSRESFHQVVQSYLGLLKHCSGYRLETAIKNSYF